MRTQAIRPRRVHDFVSSIFDHDLHEKRVASLAGATVGALQGAQLAVGALGRALAIAKELDAKHAIKQVDRLFSNSGVDVCKLTEVTRFGGGYGEEEKDPKGPTLGTPPAQSCEAQWLSRGWSIREAQPGDATTFDKPQVRLTFSVTKN